MTVLYSQNLRTETVLYPHGGQNQTNEKIAVLNVSNKSELEDTPQLPAM